METEKRLIDADELLKRLDQLYGESPSEHYGDDWKSGVVLSISEVEGMPDEDAKPILEAEWIPIPREPFGLPTNAKETHKCSHCSMRGYNRWKYCSNCGAEMKNGGYDPYDLA